MIEQKRKDIENKRAKDGLLGISTGMSELDDIF